VIIRTAAKRDIVDVVTWYEERKEGLGKTFRSVIDRVLERVEAMPEAHRIVHRTTRRAVVSGFPYAIYYKVENGEVIVLAVIHSHRDSQDWQSRM
jgi:plasmid stabilization system protein ParE